MRIRHKKHECIGCALCEQEAPSYFVMDEEGMATLLDFQQVGVFQTGEGLEIDRAALKRAADGCPVNIIHID
ncbi:MAG: ferredoxin [Verrucomicrobiales bacterium]|nr:ferredoxin [Verrucomicrobiales bacterium]